MRNKRRNPERKIVLKRSGRDLFESRTIVVGVGFVLLMALLFARAVQLQAVQHDKWMDEAVKRHRKNIELTRRRGPILDRKGRQLAFSIDVDSVYADPKFVTDPNAAAQALHEVLGVDTKKALARLTKQNSRFAWIKRKITEEQSKALRAKNIPGIYYLREADRRYSYGELAAPVLGFVGTDGSGLEGIEAIYDSKLAGEPWRMAVERDASGNVFLTNGLDDLTTSYGGTVRLTIDAQIQYFAEQALEEGVKAVNARMGMALVVDPNTGEILAMAQRPAFNCNTGSKAPQWNRTNHVVVDTFEPGSTLKPFIVAAALQDHLVRPEDTFNCEGGSMTVGKHVVHDAHPYGTLSVAQIVQKSSNIGVSKIGFRLGARELHSWLTKYGFGSRSGLGFPGESAGLLSAPDNWRQIHISNLAFGQGISVSCLQMATAFSTLVNGGSVMRPFLVSEVMDQNGLSLQQTGTSIVDRVLSPETSRTITGIMTMVTQPGGTGTRAAIEGFPVAGKTGTAQKALPNGRGYHPTARVGSFIGAVPADRPRLVAIVVMDEPQGAMGSRYGGVCAAPVFKQIAERTLHYLNETTDQKLPEEPPVKGYQMAFAEPSEDEIERDIEAVQEDMTPNLIGLPINEVVRIAGMAEVQLRIEGSGISFEQDPSPGKPLSKSREVKVVCRPTS